LCFIVPKEDKEMPRGAFGWRVEVQNDTARHVTQNLVHGNMCEFRKRGPSVIRRYPVTHPSSKLIRFYEVTPLMRSAMAFLALLVFAGHAALAEPPLGPQGVEGEPNREQPWRVPTPHADISARAVLFRPQGEGPFRLALIAHATTQNVLRRAQMPQPEYRALAAFLVARGFAVLVPERLGHGGTGGKYLEDQGGCDDADYSHAARATAEEIALPLEFLRAQSFIRKDGAVILGHSAGGWGALALAGGDRNSISAIIAFAPGRGGHANDFPNQVCAPHTLLASAAEFGKAARVPVTWLVAANDTYFSPELSRRLAGAFRSTGGRVDFHVLAPAGSEGHWLIETESGVRIASPDLERALELQTPAVKKR
jgi:dienelactone hydrolase